MDASAVAGASGDPVAAAAASGTASSRWLCGVSAASGCGREPPRPRPRPPRRRRRRAPWPVAGEPGSVVATLVAPSSGVSDRGCSCPSAERCPSGRGPPPPRPRPPRRRRRGAPEAVPVPPSAPLPLPSVSGVAVGGAGARVEGAGAAAGGAGAAAFGGAGATVSIVPGVFVSGLGVRTVGRPARNSSLNGAPSASAVGRRVRHEAGTAGTCGPRRDGARRAAGSCERGARAAAGAARRATGVVTHQVLILVRRSRPASAPDRPGPAAVARLLDSSDPAGVRDLVVRSRQRAGLPGRIAVVPAPGRHPS